MLCLDCADKPLARQANVMSTPAARKRSGIGVFMNVIGIQQCILKTSSCFILNDETRDE